MLSKCANPGCRNSFLYLHEGKLFRMHTDATQSGLSSGNNVNAEAKKPTRRVEYYWLCQRCAAQMTLSFEDEVGVKIQLLRSVHAVAS